MILDDICASQVDALAYEDCVWRMLDIRKPDKTIVCWH
jgi:hypothetical protein